MELRLAYERQYQPPPIAPTIPFSEIGGEVTGAIKAKFQQPPPGEKGRKFTAAEITGKGENLSPGELIRRAQICFVNDDYAKAAEYLEALVEVRPTAEAYFLLGMCHMNMGNFASAARALEEAGRINPRHRDVQFNLGAAYLMEATKLGDRGGVEKSIGPFKKAFELGDQKDAALALGFVYDILKNWRQAERYYLKATRLATAVLAYTNLANLYARLGREKQQSAEGKKLYLKAADAYRKALAITPRDADLYNLLGDTYMSMGMSPQAIEAFETAVEIEGSNFLALGSLGAAYMDAGRFAEARGTIRRTISAGPQAIETYIVERLRQPAAEADLVMADTHVGYAMACMELYRMTEEENGDGTADPGLLREAEAALSKAIEIDPGLGMAYYTLAALLQRQGRLPEAREALLKALKVEPENEFIKEHARKFLEDQLQQSLLASGLIREIKTPITDFSRYKNRKPIVVQGKPLSETILEDRR